MNKPTKKIVSFETPPSKGQHFVVICKNNKMILMDDLEVWNKMKSKMVKEDEILGWLPVDKDNRPPPFLQMNMPNKG